jgi:hypothetical protein
MAGDMAKAFPSLIKDRQEAKAIIIENNGLGEPVQIRQGQALQVAPFRCDRNAKDCWSAQSVALQAQLSSLSGSTRVLFDEQASIAPMVVALSEEAESSGWQVDVGQGLQMAGYAIGGVDGAAGTAHSALGRIQTLAGGIVKDAAQALGPQAITSKSASDLGRLERFLKGHHKYGQLRAEIDRLPGFLKSRLGSIAPTPGVDAASARWMRRQFIIPADKMASASRYVSTTSGRLAASAQFVGRLGAATTWVLPAAVGIWNAANTPAHLRSKVTLQETAGVVLGWGGTMLGVFLGGMLVTILAFTGVGAFVVIALAGAGMGLALSEGGKAVTGSLYDLLSL